MIAKTGIVVPTLGTRPEYLEHALQSIRKAGNCFVLIVSPSSVDLSRYLDAKLADKVVDDPGQGLAAAINYGLYQLPKEIHFVNWLGDDDQLIEHSIDKCENALERSKKSTFVYGGCDYISESEKLLWTNKSGRWASILLRFGPDLIPQPGALIRREALSSVGGLNTQYKLAFDLDLFLKLIKLGPGNFLGETLARFRWHENSLSVAQRREAVREASLIRIRHLPFWLRPVSELWEFPVRWLTLHAARIVERNLKGK